MQTSPLLPAPTEDWHWYRLEAVRDLMNGAYNVLALNDLPDAATVKEARGNIVLAEAELDAMIGHDGPGDARAAAVELKPRLQRATEDLERIGAEPTPEGLQSVLTEYGNMMDHIEQALAAVAWDN